MEELSKAMALLPMAIGAIFIAVLLGPVFGGLAGWVVGLLFESTILKVLAAFGVTGIEVWELGAFMGFVGGFLKTTTTVKGA